MSRISRRVDSIKPSATIVVSSKSMELKAAGRDIVSLGFGEPDFDTPDHIKNAAIAAINAGQTKYTQVDGTPEIKSAIVDKFQRDNDLSYQPNQVLVSNGAKQSLYNLLVAVLNDGDEVIVPAPYWVSYPDMAKLAGANPVVIQASAQHDHKITPGELAAALTRQTRLLILNSPSNPTGKVYTAAEYRAFGDALRDYSRVVIACDDIYEHIYWGDGPYRTFLNACPEFSDRTVVINGVSKAYAMTGWRIGYAAGPEDLIKAMKKVQGQTTSCAGSVSQAAAIAALNGSQDCVEEMRREYESRYEFVRTALNEIPGVKCPDAEGAFYALPNFEGVLAAIPSLSNDVDLANWLLEEAGVSTVPGSAFGAPGHLRLSFAASLDYLRDAITRINTAIATS